MDYNVRRVLSGDPAPSVQISQHPISAEGLLVLTPLLEAEDPIIRNGIQALLAERLEHLERERRHSSLGWTAYQLADEQLLKKLQSERSRLSVFPNTDDREYYWHRPHSREEVGRKPGADKLAEAVRMEDVYPQG